MLNPMQALHALDQLRTTALCSGQDHDMYREALVSLRTFVQDAMQQRPPAKPRAYTEQPADKPTE